MWNYIRVCKNCQLIKNLWIPLIQKPGTHSFAFIMVVIIEARWEDNASPPSPPQPQPCLCTHSPLCLQCFSPGTYMTLGLSLGLHSNGVSSSLVPAHAPSSYPACVFFSVLIISSMFYLLTCLHASASLDGKLMEGRDLVCFVQGCIPAPAAVPGLQQVLHKGMPSCEQLAVTFSLMLEVP